jgi:hypothetical protein
MGSTQRSKHKKRQPCVEEKREFIPRVPCKYWLKGACQKGSDCTFPTLNRHKKRMNCANSFSPTTVLREMHVLIHTVSFFGENSDF